MSVSSQQLLPPVGVISRKGLTQMKLGLVGFAFAWLQDGLAVMQSELLRLIVTLCCPNVRAYRQQSPPIMPLSVFQGMQKPFMYVTLSKADRDCA